MRAKGGGACADRRPNPLRRLAARAPGCERHHRHNLLRTMHLGRSAPAPSVATRALGKAAAPPALGRSDPRSPAPHPPRRATETSETRTRRKAWRPEVAFAPARPGCPRLAPLVRWEGTESGASAPPPAARQPQFDPPTPGAPVSAHPAPFPRPARSSPHAAAARPRFEARTPGAPGSAHRAPFPRPARS